MRQKEEGGKKISIKTKLIGISSVAIILSIVIVATIAVLLSSRALMRQAYNQLDSVRVIKTNQIRNFVNERISDVDVYSKNSAIKLCMQRFDAAFRAGGKNGAEMKKWDALHGPILKHYMESYGYYDLFFIANDGNIVYTVCKEKDFGQNLITGNLSKTGLAKVFNKGKTGVAFGDFEWYAPSNAPACFVASPILDVNNNRRGVLVFQVGLKSINSIMQERAGMGRTGETYLVGPDKRMRSDSFLDPEGHSVKASFAGTIEKNGVDTDAVRESFAGKSGTKVIVDYNGNDVLSSYASIDLAGAKWAVIAEIDYAEINEPVANFRNYVIGISLLIIGVAIYFFYLFINRTIVKPVLHINEICGHIANGDLTKTVDFSSNDEIGELSASFNQFIVNMHDIILQVVFSSQNLAQAVEQISSGNQNLSQRSAEQASSLEEIASTIEESTATIRQNAENAQEADVVAKETRGLGEEGNKVVSTAVQSINEMNESSKKIGDIISVINEIAFQTNLLALNAAVEAARAGEQGRGFAVVAGEVRNLAQRSASAVKEIGDLIKNSMGKVDVATELANKSGESLNEIVGSIEKVSKLIGEIAAASEEQRNGIEQINIAVTEMDSMTQQNSALVEETASASEEMSNQARELLDMVQQFKVKQGKNSDVAVNKNNSGMHSRHIDKGNGKNAIISNGGNGNGSGQYGPGHVQNGKPEENHNVVKETLAGEGFEEF